MSRIPATRTPSQIKRAEALAAKREREKSLAEARTKAQARSQMLAQIVNLHIGGYSLEQIGASIGASADEVDRMLTSEAARYVRTQPQLRTYVRNWISEKYLQMLDADYPMATDPNHPLKLENQDRAMRILDRMAKLHGADAPTQSEIRVDAAPEAVEKMVQALAAQQGGGYDVNIFDVVDGEVVHDALEQTTAALSEQEEADE